MRSQQLLFNENFFNSLHTITNRKTLVSTHLVMLTPNRDYWTGALATGFHRTRFWATPACVRTASPRNNPTAWKADSFWDFSRLCTLIQINCWQGFWKTQAIYWI
jgi:hypothetical protein